MSIAKRLWEMEQKAGVDPGVGSTGPNGESIVTWEHLKEIQAESLKDDIEAEFGVTAITVTEDDVNDLTVTLKFRWPFVNAQTDSEIETRIMMIMAYDVVMKIDKEIQDRQEATCQSFSMTVEASGVCVLIKFAGVTLWMSHEASLAEMYDVGALELRIRQELGEFVETVKTMEGVG